MEKSLLTVNEASLLIGKSTQTIRRLIRNKLIKFRRKRTPQGFNYFIEKQSILMFFGMADEGNAGSAADEFLPEDDAPDMSPQHSPRHVTPQYSGHSTPHASQNHATPVYRIQEQQHFSAPQGHQTPEPLMDDLHALPQEPIVTQDEKILPIKNDDSVFAETVTVEAPKHKDAPRQELDEFNNTLHKLISQYERIISQQDEDKRNLFKLVGTFQERIMMLEQRIKQLEAPKKKKWYHFLF